MRQIAIDIETFSPAPLAKTGVYPYAEHPDFGLLIFGYSIDGRPVEVVDLASGGRLPDEVLTALVDPAWSSGRTMRRLRGSRSPRGCSVITPSCWQAGFLTRASGAARWCGRLTSVCR